MMGISSVQFSHSVMSDSLRLHGPPLVPLSLGFPRQEYWSGLPFHFPGDLFNPQIWTCVPYAGRQILPVSHQGSPLAENSYKLNIEGVAWFFLFIVKCDKKEVNFSFFLHVRTQWDYRPLQARKRNLTRTWPCLLASSFHTSRTMRKYICIV